MLLITKLEINLLHRFFGHFVWQSAVYDCSEKLVNPTLKIVQ